MRDHQIRIHNNANFLQAKVVFMKSTYDVSVIRIKGEHGVSDDIIIYHEWDDDMQRSVIQEKQDVL